MQKINFQNLPNTTTPVSAGNLNQLQDNVENVFDGSDTMNNIKVNGDISINSLKTLKTIYSKSVNGNATETFTLPDTNALYFVIGHVNGDEIHCVFDIVYAKGLYHTRIKESTSQSVKITYNSSTGVVTMQHNYGAMFCIIEILMN